MRDSPRGQCALLAGLWVGLTVAMASLQAGEVARITLKPRMTPSRQPERPPLDLDPGLPREPINLATALQLANVRPLNVMMAQQRVQVAAARLQKARALWLPTLFLGTDYARQDGQIQNIQGNVLTTSRSSFMAGAGPYAVFALSDAFYAPLAARQVMRGRSASVQTALNDTLLDVAESYFTVQQARGELAGALDSLQRAGDLVARTEKLAPGLAPELEVYRARTERDRRLQTVASTRERWRTASAELARVLRLDPTSVLEPVEPPQLRVELVSLSCPLDQLIPVALRNRPELATHQALVEATLRRLQQERLRPLIPSILLRGNATNPTNSLSSGLFGGGINSNLSNFGARNAMDIQLLWELQNLGFGNRAAIRERRAENELAVLELFRTQDRIAAEVASALAQAQNAAVRAAAAESALKNALESAQKNLEGLSQTRRAGELLILVVRPQEAVASVQALAQTYTDYYAAVADANRAQFRLYRALGEPAQQVAEQLPASYPAKAP
jgi:outer membrane protein TolC